jgi:hypothetical protein
MARGPACDNWTQFPSVDPLRDARASIADQVCDLLDDRTELDSHFADPFILMCR